MILFISGKEEKEYLKEVLRDYLENIPPFDESDKKERLQKILNRIETYEKMQKRN